MKMPILLFMLSAGFITTLCAQNPIVPAGVYIADPAAHVWEDGKLYVYGSVDETTDYYCSHRHHVLSSNDLLNWTLHENVLASSGEHDAIPYSDSLLYAPDCQYKDGKYYMYYTLNSPANTEGVAMADGPTGPFRGARPIDLYGYNQIDPAVFIDDDGTAYYIWGQFTAKMARLKPNMTEIDPATIRDSIVTEAEHYFHEGGYLVKRNGIYYFIYAHMGRAGRPTCIGYATSYAPMGPYRYGGVIVDNDHSDPAVWNNHGSIVEYNGQWYVFYHRSTHGSVMMRKACVEPIHFNPDDSIDEVEMTSQGAGPPLQASAKIPAERACLLYGNVRIQAFANDNEELGGIRNGDFAAYKYLDFGSGVKSVTIRVAPGKDPGKIAMKLGHSWHRNIGIIEIPGGGDARTWQEITVDVDPVAGVHALWLRFLGEGDELFALDWIRFNN
jgi:arabinoxylan arabinofuranohydrolase